MAKRLDMYPADTVQERKRIAERVFAINDSYLIYVEGSPYEQEMVRRVFKEVGTRPVDIVLHPGTYSQKLMALIDSINGLQVGGTDG